MAMFKGFKPQGMQKIANKMGYQGAMENFDNYLEQNPDKQREMLVYQDTARKMARGGVLYAREGSLSTGSQNLKAKSVLQEERKIKQQPAKIKGIQTYLSDNKDAVIDLGYNRRPLPIFRGGRGQVQPRQLSQSYTPKQKSVGGKKIGQVTAERLQSPGLPEGAMVKPVGTKIEDGQIVDPFVGQTYGDITVDPKVAETKLADQPSAEKDANIVTDVDQRSEQVNSALDATQAAQTNPNDPRAKVVAAQQTASSVGDLNAAQGNALKMDNPVQREIQQGELIQGVANAEKAAKFTEQIQAAETQPSEKATVQGQLAELTSNFDATNPPAWAAGALRGVQAAMAARGLGASSMAGQALVQAAMESALPIASADAQTQASFEAQNLSNRQSRAMLAAQQRATFMGQEFDQAFQARVQNASKISDVANMNFTADQQIALENSRAANSMNMANLNNNQAMVMAEASALANMDMSNLSNRQQSAVQNAQNFLQLDMANMTNRQQTEVFKAQQRVQSLFTDQAAVNASKQFNATSQNQTDQFFANLSQQASQYNASQTNAQNQFNAGQINTAERFNAELNNQRDQFNANNQLVIAQNNAQWRRQVATADTAAVNRANELNATAVLDISKQAYDNLWQMYGDTMEFAWKSAESQLDRMTKLAVAQLDADTQALIASKQAASGAGQALGGLIGTIGGALVEFGTGNLLG